MTARLGRAAACLAVVAGAAGGSFSAWAQSGSQVSLTASLEAWHSFNPACAAAIDCSVVPPTSPYPPDTLHVAAALGTPTATSYLEFDTRLLPDLLGSVILVMPINPDPSAGGVAVESATLKICAVTGFIEPAEGSTESPPSTACDELSTQALFHADPAPRFEADITAFAQAWSTGSRPAIGILPDDSAQTPAATWHVTFWGRKNTDTQAAPITAEASGTNSPAPTTSPDPSRPPSEMPSPTARPTPPPRSPGFPVAPVLPAPPVEVPEPDVAPPPEAGPGPTDAATPQGRTRGYPYRIVFLAPLALLAGVSIAGRVLGAPL